MDIDSVAARKLRATLTLHFAVLAWLTAMLVATGSGSIFLPVFIFLVTVAAFIFVDTLEWFELGRIGSYVGMSVATIVSIASYYYNAFTIQSESGQLLAVAGLLVYPEAVLFLQRKSLRVFEQLAVFLLLEMIVAALVNDNILFGILLAPIMLLWVSALFLFSRYATMVQIAPNIEQPQVKLAELIYRKLMKSVIGESQKPNVVTSRSTLNEVRTSRLPRRIAQSFPIGAGAIAFACFFFYLLPRTAPSGFEPTLGFEARVGLPKSLSIGTVGRLLQDPTPVMRVSIKRLTTGGHYEVLDPPYLRARVMDTYSPAVQGQWVQYGEWIFGGIHEYRKLKTLESEFRRTDRGRDIVELEFDIKRRFANTLFLVPPAFAKQGVKQIESGYDRLNMVLEEVDASKLKGGKSLVYTIGSTAFANGQQLRVVPAAPLLGSTSIAENRTLHALTRDFGGFVKANDYRAKLMKATGVNIDSPYRVAETIESHLLSNRFSYTLDLRPPTDPDLDPIEDFLINQKKGHCQYFATAMLMLLRQSGIPSRVVVGYRPTEFNRLGSYFPVKQSDAHAWVEGLFTREDLLGTEHERWLSDEPLYWVRFDPTPGSDGGEVLIVQQQGQAIDYAEKLWKDYVVEGQKLNSGALYNPVSENSKDAYQNITEKLQNLKQNMESGRFFSAANGIGFEWQLTILIIGIGTFLILLWQLLAALPRLAPRLAQRLGMKRDRSEIKQVFFARCVALLERNGLTRENGETPKELTDRAAKLLKSGPSFSTDDQLARSLSFLTSIYYRIRFGKSEQLNSTEINAIEEALAKLETASGK